MTRIVSDTSGTEIESVFALTAALCSESAGGQQRKQEEHGGRTRGHVHLPERLYSQVAQRNDLVPACHHQQKEKSAEVQQGKLEMHGSMLSDHKLRFCNTKRMRYEYIRRL
jgi:hypothetical protein